MTSIIDIIEEVRRSLESRDYKAFAECFDEEGVYERPFALKGTIDKYVGRDNIYQFIEAGMAAANKLFSIICVEVETHPCEEKNIIFAAFFLSGKTFLSGDIFKIASSSALITCKEDKIIIYRDFPNSLGIAQAAGTLPQLAASLIK